MKIIIFSDTHLTDQVDQQKLQFLRRIITYADRVIIIGDFWDNWYTDFDRFIASPWQELFPALLAKKTWYIHGNHDPQAECDKRVRWFSVKNTLQAEIKSGKYRFTICHGHLLLNGIRPFPVEQYSRILDRLNGSKLGSVLHTGLKYADLGLQHLNGSNYASHSSIAKNNNDLLKKQGIVINKPDQWLICGNTHCPEIDRQHRFANTGCIKNGIAAYLEITDGSIKLHQDKYK
jgi:predicted phosphodiesterase